MAPGGGTWGPPSRPGPAAGVRAGRSRGGHGRAAPADRVRGRRGRRFPVALPKLYVPLGAEGAPHGLHPGDPARPHLPLLQRRASGPHRGGGRLQPLPALRGRHARGDVRVFGSGRPGACRANPEPASALHLRLHSQAHRRGPLLHHHGPQGVRAHLPAAGPRSARVAVRLRTRGLRAAGQAAQGAQEEVGQAPSEVPALRAAEGTAGPPGQLQLPGHAVPHRGVRGGTPGAGPAGAHERLRVPPRQLPQPAR